MADAFYEDVDHKTGSPHVAFVAVEDFPVGLQ